MPIINCPADESTRTRTGVVVTATHPILGALYWEFVSEASVGGPDYYSIAQSTERALLLEPKWRDEDMGFYGSHMQRVYQDHVVEHNESDFYGIEFRHGLAVLHAQSGQSESEFLDWLKSAAWIDAPGPTRIEQKIDHGYVVEWVTIRQTVDHGD